MTIVTIELPAGGTKHFTKLVFVWACHTVTGWATNSQQYTYGDELNGVYACGCDQQYPELFTWFIPAGKIYRTQATHVDSVDARYQFGNTYGDRLIVALNKKPDYPTIETWVPNMSVTPEVFGLQQFTGTTLDEFVQYCDYAMDELNKHPGWLISSMR